MKTGSDNQTTDLEPFVVTEERRAVLRYFAIMFGLLVAFPISLDLATGEPITKLRLFTLATFALVAIFLAAWPRQQLMRVDSSGFTFGRKRFLPWSDIESIRSGVSPRFARLYQLFWGDNTAVQVFPKQGAKAGHPGNPMHKYQRWFFGTQFTLLCAMGNRSAREIAQACERFSDVPVVRG